MLRGDLKGQIRLFNGSERPQSTPPPSPLAWICPLLKSLTSLPLLFDRTGSQSLYYSLTHRLPKGHLYLSPEI